MKARVLHLIISIPLFLSACASRGECLEVGQTFRADHLSGDDTYFDVHYLSKEGATILLEISRSGAGSLGIVHSDDFQSVIINGAAREYVETQAPIGAKRIYIVDFVEDISEVEIEFESADFSRICLDDTAAVDWTDQGSIESITISTK